MACESERRVPATILMRILHRVNQLCIERNQKNEEPMSLRSKMAEVACRGTSKNRPRSNKGTPRAWVLKGALRGLDAMVQSDRSQRRFYLLKV